MSDYETSYKKSYAQDYGQPYGQSYGQSYGGSYSRYDEDENPNWTYLISGALFVAAGAYLIYRGVSSDDELQEYRHNASGEAYGASASTSKDTKEQRGDEERGEGIEVNESIVIDKSAAELYGYWRKLENLPQIMSHLESVTETGARSHWKAKAPLGLSVEWDATVTEDRPDELIAWRSDKDARVPNEGSVRFSGVGSSSLHNPYTVVAVSLTYHPPFGPVGVTLAKLFGQEPSQQVKDDLQKFKQAVESGSLSLGNSGLSGGLESSSF